MCIFWLIGMLGRLVVRILGWLCLPARLFGVLGRLVYNSEWLRLPANQETVPNDKETLPCPIDDIPTPAQANTATDSEVRPTLAKQTILRIVKAMNVSTSFEPFILIGGASLIFHGSTRITNDIDLLVSLDSLDKFVTAREAVLGGLTDEDREYIDQIDLLLVLVDRFEQPVNKESIQHFVVKFEGVDVPELDVLLGAKITAHHCRAEGYEGTVKRRSDLSDIHWISIAMRKQCVKVRKEVCCLFTCGPYNMLLVVEELYKTFGREGIEVFELVGGREFECEWGNKEFADQAEYYQIEIEEGGYGEDEIKILQSRRKASEHGCT